MDPQQIIAAVASDLKLDLRRVAAAVSLFDDGNTIPFIARYRKEVTGSLDEEELRQVETRLGYRRHMEERRGAVLQSLEEQDILSPELQAKVTTAETLQRIEDLYRPYKPKRRTRATIARDKGLQSLANHILAQSLDVDRDKMAQPFITEEVPTIDAAYAGARDIVAETIADHPEVREALRKLTSIRSQLSVDVADESKDKDGTYQHYYGYTAWVSQLRPHHILALNRGEKQGVLRIDLDIPEAQAMDILNLHYAVQSTSPFGRDLDLAKQDSYARLLKPAVTRDTRRTLTESADTHAIDVFATNLKALLLQPPLRGQTVLAIDPGFRTGGKVAVVDATGKTLATTTIYPDRRKQQAIGELNQLIKRHGVTVIAIGNGTASRETEAFVAELITEGTPVKYTIVSEAGASVYSASRLARAELPELDVSLRGAVSIARRLQDPLAELVKIEPKAIGVGLYQHDVDQKALAQALDVVIESAVNNVGVDLNTASAALLQRVSGIGPKLAQTIVEYRDQNGPFSERKRLQGVAGLGPKTFEQAAGFVRIPDSENLLDNTSIHPESYAAAEVLLRKLHGTLGDNGLRIKLYRLRNSPKLLKAAAADLGIGEPTLLDIIEALERPGRDPRETLEGPILRSDVLSIDDLQPGMQLKGTIRNVVDFGAFVDIGVKRNGLIHISQMGKGYIASPYDRVSVGDVVTVEILEVDQDRGRIGLKLC